jgi:transcriptional regulator of nitric oxide reductase
MMLNIQPILKSDSVASKTMQHIARSMSQYLPTAMNHSHWLNIGISRELKVQITMRSPLIGHTFAFSFSKFDQSCCAFVVVRRQSILKTLIDER